MNNPHLTVLQVNLRDIQGGAAQISWNLHRAFQRRGITDYVAVERKFSADDKIFVIEHEKYKPSWIRFIRKIGRKLQASSPTIRGTGHLGDFLIARSNYQRRHDFNRGIEDFYAPGTKYLLEQVKQPIDILQLHNLHKDWTDHREYFDLRALPYLCSKVPTVITLHDAWTLSGHCAHSFECERWRTGCGNCPDLSIYPAIRKDNTAYNWNRKKAIFSQCNLSVITPSQWLMDKVDQSILKPAIRTKRVIPNGVDLSIFHPGKGDRDALGFPTDVNILLFTADGISINKFKDFATLRKAIYIVSQSISDILFIALGEEGPNETIGSAQIRFIPYTKDSDIVASYYRAADLYLHAARADTFPNTVIEALACGTPVISTEVGGISEQIKNGETGFLTPMGDAPAMADRIMLLIRERGLRTQMGHLAFEDAAQRFNLELQVDRYLSFYNDILSKINNIKDNVNP